MTGFEPLAVSQNWNQATSGDWAEVLAEFPLFSRLGTRRLRKLAQEGTFAEFAPGDTVVLTGAPADSFYVILSGKAQARGKPNARTLSTGDHFGEMALVDNGRRSATVIATEELHVLRLPRQAFLELLDEDGVALTIVKELGARVRRLEGLPQAG
jgi:CRP/FNR family transcriptional regulator, cyclic AMP receptor protein